MPQSIAANPILVEATRGDMVAGFTEFLIPVGFIAECELHLV